MKWRQQSENGVSSQKMGSGRCLLVFRSQKMGSGRYLLVFRDHFRVWVEEAFPL